MDKRKNKNDIMRVCVLQPDYSTSGVDYKNYDPPRDLSKLLPNAIVDHVFLNKLSTYKQLKELSKKNYTVFVNLCEGYLEWDVPSIDVVYFLEQLNLPFTGPSSVLYDPSKELMKYVAYLEGIKTPQYTLIEKIEDIELSCSHLHYPLFVKPSKAGDSLGIDAFSFVKNIQELKNKIATIVDDYGPVLVEEYIDGREFTVMLVNNPENNKTQTIYNPIEYIFPDGVFFKTYDLKTSSLHPNSNVELKDEAIVLQLKKASAAKK